MNSTAYRALLGLWIVVAISGCDTSREPSATPVHSPIADSATEPAFDSDSPPAQGTYRAWLDSPGGELPFGLVLTQVGDDWQADLVNGSETIRVPATRYADGQLTLSIPHYDSKLTARWLPSKRELEGSWTKRSTGDKWTEMPFHARLTETGERDREQKTETGVFEGRYRVEFSDSSDPAVGIFRRSSHGVEGTFLTTTGDYRFLAGDFSDNRLTLSCFDGAHAFLFRAEFHDDGHLAGDFWSRDSWHETWQATPDDSSELPSGFEQTQWVEGVTLAQLRFPDLQGTVKSLADPAFDGRARIIYVFGSWCPNCHDAAVFLSELHDRFADQGLSIVGLAFELTGEFKRDAAQVETYRERHNIKYPLLLAGVADKTKATEQLRALDRVRSYPTLIFLNGAGEPQAIYSGFSGPATGPAYDRLREQCLEQVQRLLEQ